MRAKHLLPLFAFIAACHTPTRTDDPTAFMRRHVETGLCNPVFIAGDSAWTIEERMKHYGVHGVSIAVIDSFKIAWVKSYGVMDTMTQQPVTDSTLFQAASISKPVFTMAMLKLVEEGALKLDENVNDRLTSWKVPENEFTTTEKVTLQRLLGHVAGTTVHGFEGYLPGAPLPSLVQILNGEAPANSPPVEVDQVPGSAWRYSGGGYCIAAQLMLDAKGGTVPQHMHDLVLKPLGMTHSTYEQPLPAAWTNNAATGYVPDGTMTQGKWHVYPEIAPDGLWTTATDLARFVIDMQKTMASDSGKVLMRSTAKQMVEPFVDPHGGVGFSLIDLHGARYFEHGGWNEGFCGEIIGHVESGKGVVILINANQPDFMGEVVRSVMRAYDWPGVSTPHKPVPMDDAAMKQLTGRYRGGADNSVTIALRNGKLYREPLRESPTELVHIGDGRFVCRTDDRTRKFEKQPDGNMGLIVSGPSKDDPFFTLERMKDDEHVPFEFIKSGDREAALKAYEKLRAAQPDEMAVNEQVLNTTGYELLNSGELQQARDLLYVNMKLYPQSANVYDSYAEACLKLGDKREALANYKRASAMDPQNMNAAGIVLELEKDGVVAK